MLGNTVRRRKSKYAKEIAFAMGLDPAVILSEVVMTGRLNFRGPNGEPTGEGMSVPVEEVMKMVRDLMSYCYPKLSAVQVTGKNEGPIQAVTADLNKLLADPASVEMATRLALQIDELREDESDESEIVDIGPAE